MRRDAIQEIVSQLFQQPHAKKQLMLFRVIKRLINSNVVEVRLVCENLLSNLVYHRSGGSTTAANFTQTDLNANPTSGATGTSLTNLITTTTKIENDLNSYTNNSTQMNSKNNQTTSLYMWCKVLECIRMLLPKYDYKSCRDIFKMLLEVVKRVPHSYASLPPQLANEIDDLKVKTNDNQSMKRSNSIITNKYKKEKRNFYFFFSILRLR
jgi:hypothetical protein